MLRNVAGHLGAGKTFVFESRNPNINWPGEWDGASDVYSSGPDWFQISTRVLSSDSEFVTFEHTYTFRRDTLKSGSKLRFPARTAVEQLISKAGLMLVYVFGDWNRSPFDRQLSEEMIFQVSRA